MPFNMPYIPTSKPKGETRTKGKPFKKEKSRDSITNSSSEEDNSIENVSSLKENKEKNRKETEKYFFISFIPQNGLEPIRKTPKRICPVILHKRAPLSSSSSRSSSSDSHRQLHQNARSLKKAQISPVILDDSSEEAPKKERKFLAIKSIEWNNYNKNTNLTSSSSSLSSLEGSLPISMASKKTQEKHRRSKTKRKGSSESRSSSSSSSSSDSFGEIQLSKKEFKQKEKEITRLKIENEILELRMKKMKLASAQLPQMNSPNGFYQVSPVHPPRQMVFESPVYRRRIDDGLDPRCYRVIYQQQFLDENQEVSLKNGLSHHRMIPIQDLKHSKEREEVPFEQEIKFQSNSRGTLQRVQNQNEEKKREISQARNGTSRVLLYAASDEEEIIESPIIPDKEPKQLQQNQSEKHNLKRDSLFLEVSSGVQKPIENILDSSAKSKARVEIQLPTETASQRSLKENVEELAKKLEGFSENQQGEHFDNEAPDEVESVIDLHKSKTKKPRKTAKGRKRREENLVTVQVSNSFKRNSIDKCHPNLNFIVDEGLRLKSFAFFLTLW